jgi:hypothetical protein
MEPAAHLSRDRLWWARRAAVSPAGAGVAVAITVGDIAAVAASMPTCPDTRIVVGAPFGISPPPSVVGPSLFPHLEQYAR